MDISQLEYFSVVAKLEHMSRAAEKLNISQPALSAKIKNLEEELGTELFTRRGRSITLNDNGRLFLAAILPMLNKLNSVKQIIAGQAASNITIINFVSPSLSSYPGLIERINNAAPQVLINKAYRDISEVAAALDEGSVDFCFSRWSVSGANICSTPLLQDELLLYVSRSHPLAQRSIISLSELKTCNFAAYSPASATGFNVNELCLSFGFKPKITFVGNTPGELVECVKSGGHIMLLPRSLYVQHCRSNPDMVGVPISDNNSCPPMRLYWRYSDSENETLSAVRRAIIDYFLTFKQ